MDMSPSFTVSAWTRPPLLPAPSGVYRPSVFTSSGDKVLVQEVLFDAVVTAPLEAYWTSLVLNKSEFVLFTLSRVIEPIGSRKLGFRSNPCDRASL